MMTFSAVKFVGIENLEEPRRDIPHCMVWGDVYSGQWETIKRRIPDPPNLIPVQFGLLYLTTASVTAELIEGKGITNVIELGDSDDKDVIIPPRRVNICSRVLSTPIFESLQQLDTAIEAEVPGFRQRFSICNFVEHCCSPFDTTPEELSDCTTTSSARSKAVLLIRCRRSMSVLISHMIGIISGWVFLDRSLTQAQVESATTSFILDRLRQLAGGYFPENSHLPDMISLAQLDLLHETLRAVRCLPQPSQQTYALEGELNASRLFLKAYFSSSHRLLGEGLAHGFTDIIAPLETLVTSAKAEIRSDPLWLRALIAIHGWILFLDERREEAEVELKAAHGDLAAWNDTQMRESKRVLDEETWAKQYFPDYLFWLVPCENRKSVLLHCLGLLPYSAADNWAEPWSLIALISKMRRLIDSILYNVRLIALSSSWDWHRWLHEELRGVLLRFDTKLAAWQTFTISSQGLWSGVL